MLIPSWITLGNVPAVARELRARDLRPVLVSNLPDDPGTGFCDDHVVFDRDGEETSALVARIDERGFEPIAVVSMVEKLMEWNLALTTHYGLPGGDAGRSVLASKSLVREHMRALGLSDLRFSGDPRSVDFFPAIVKPARESSASYLVKQVNDREELLAYLKHLEESGAGGVELIAEEFVPGTEFFVDGPVPAVAATRSSRWRSSNCALTTPHAASAEPRYRSPRACRSNATATRVCRTASWRSRRNSGAAGRPWRCRRTPPRAAGGRRRSPPGRRHAADLALNGGAPPVATAPVLPPPLCFWRSCKRAAGLRARYDCSLLSSA